MWVNVLRSNGVGEYVVSEHEYNGIGTIIENINHLQDELTALAETVGDSTPVKGVDYFTEEDKAEIVAAVVAALPVYEGEVSE